MCWVKLNWIEEMEERTKKKRLRVGMHTHRKMVGKKKTILLVGFKLQYYAVGRFAIVGFGKQIKQLYWSDHDDDAPRCDACCDQKKWRCNYRHQNGSTKLPARTLRNNQNNNATENKNRLQIQCNVYPAVDNAIKRCRTYWNWW